MLLISAVSRCCVFYLSVIMMGSAPHASPPRLGCVLEVPVYDPHGSRLRFRVNRVAVRDGNMTRDLLGKQVDGIYTTASGDRVFFSTDRIVGKRAIEVSLEGPNGTRISSHVLVTACRQRRSLSFGQSDSGLDVAFVPLRGRLVGCSYAGDWWVRTMTMFGGHDGTTAEDGYVEKDGTFTVEVAPLGVRRILVIGRGGQPVRSIGVDVTVGQSIDVGLINLTGACPQ